jgi:PqqD family protein of HPr-rel-A system
LLVLISTAGDILWQDWDDVYIVYQPLSAETHVFNETTVAILRSLELGPLPAAAVKQSAEEALGVGHGELATDDFNFATVRLEELGLIESLDKSPDVQ